MGRSGFLWISDIIAKLAVHCHHCAYFIILMIFLSPLDEGEVHMPMSWLLRLELSQAFRYLNLAVGFVLGATSATV